MRQFQQPNTLVFLEHKLDSLKGQYIRFVDSLWHDFQRVLKFMTKILRKCIVLRERVWLRLN